MLIKIACIAGTRPELIKMAPVIKAFQKYSDTDLIFVHSGQHYDENMSNIFIQELGLPEPTDNLNIGSDTPGAQTAKILVECEKLLRKHQPDLVLSEGDTNTVLASSLASIKAGIPYGHIEAGLRCYDRKMPEEINRVIADHNAELCFAPTERNALNLAFEGIPPTRIFITGNTIVDACIENLKKAKTRSKVLENLGISKRENLIILTCHRAENTDNHQRLKNIIDAITNLEEYTTVFPVHPRTRKLLKKCGNWVEVSRQEHIICTDPLSYFDFLLLLSRSKLVLTDSGGVQEEAISLKVPCLTLRYSTKRPETVEAGANILVNDDQEKIIQYTRRIMEDKQFRDKMITVANPYGDGTAGKKIAEICHKKILNGIEYETPTYKKRGAANYFLEDAEKIPNSNNSTIYKLICYFNKEGKPIFPRNSLKPEPEWKALIQKEEGSGEINCTSQNVCNTSKSVVVIIPTLNEEHGIGLTIKEVIGNIDAEIINIDANSVDKTLEIAASLGAKIVKQRGFGKGGAIAQAFRYLNYNTKYIILIDGDYTYPANYLPKMIELMEKNTDIEMVTGKRFSNNEGVFTHFKRFIISPYHFGNFILSSAHRLLNRVPMEDPLTGFRVIRYDCIRDFRPKAKSFDIEVDINNHIQKRKGKIFELPINYRQRLGEKKLKIRHGFTIFIRILTMAIENLLLQKVSDSSKDKNE